MDSKTLSYNHFLKAVQFTQKHVEREEVLEYAKLIEFLPNTFNVFNVPFYVLDYRSRQYKIATQAETISLGYESNAWLREGLDFMLNIMHKDYFSILNKNIFPITIDFLKSVPQEEHIDYLFTQNVRLKQTDGRYMMGLQKCKYITDKATSMPILTFGIMIDITPYKTDNTVIHLIDKCKTKHDIIKNVTTTYFYPYPEDSFLTKREREILCWICDGLLTKEIAAKLYISENTVANHRKNILKKTNSKNVADLIRYANSQKTI